jgi:hypothetical protein
MMMTLTIDVPVELEQRIEAEARRRGTDKGTLVRTVLEHNFTPPLPDLSATRILATDLPVRDRTRENAWLKAHRDEYDGRYVALSGDQLLAVGDSYQAVAGRSLTLGCATALIVYVEGSTHPPFISGGLE